MRAIVVGQAGVELRDVARPKPGPNQVLVRVRAAALNRADLLVAAGGAHGSAGGVGTIVGMEFAGEVAEVGADVRDFAPGDRVMASGTGGYAEYAATDRGRVHPLPAAGLNFATAATLPIALQTMHNALVTAGRLKAAEAVMIQGASSGVGLMGLQIARLKGARVVIGTSTDASRRGRLKEFGADLALDPRAPGWADEAVKATGGRGVDLTIDQVSSGVINDTMRAAAVLGRIVNVGRLGGFKGEFDFDLHALKRIDYIGVTFRTRSVEEVRTINRLMRDDLGEALAAGKLSLPIDRMFPLEQAAEALAYMKANRHFGKIVLEV